MSDANCQPESIEAQLLREMITEFRELKREVVYMRSEFGGVIAAQQQISLALGLDIVIPAPVAVPTPIPHDSWATPDDGGL